MTFVSGSDMRPLRGRLFGVTLLLATGALLNEVLR